MNRIVFFLIILCGGYISYAQTVFDFDTSTGLTDWTMTQTKNGSVVDPPAAGTFLSGVNFQGHNAASIGNMTYDSSRDQYTLERLVDLEGPFVVFDFLPVFQFYTTTAGAQTPSFIATVKDKDGQLIDQVVINGNATDCHFTVANGEMFMSAWQTYSLDVTTLWSSLADDPWSKQGNTKKVRISFIVSDRSGNTGANANATALAYLDNVTFSNTAVLNPNIGDIELNNYTIQYPDVTGGSPLICGRIIPPDNYTVQSATLSFRSNPSGSTVTPITVFPSAVDGSFCIDITSVPQWQQYFSTLNVVYSSTATCVGNTTGSFVATSQSGPMINFPSCVSARTLASDAAALSNFNSQASDYIVAYNVIYAGPDISALYHAANYIELRPGFQTVTGARFAADIQGCTNDYVYRQSNPDNAEMVEETDLTSLYVGPNPSDGIVTINASQNVREVSVYALDGKRILSLPVGQSSATIDISQARPGLYLMTMEMEDHSIETRKIIKR